MSGRRDALLGSMPNVSRPVTSVTCLDARFLPAMWIGAGVPFLQGGGNCGVSLTHT